MSGQGPTVPHEFHENVNDASMCVCGIPALTHDLVVHLATVKLLDPCPECAQGKHRNCLGQTWDPDADEVVSPCPCAEANGHEAAR